MAYPANRQGLLISLLCAALAAQCTGMAVQAAVPVVESSGTPTGGTSRSSSSVGSTSEPVARSYGADQNQPGVMASSAPDVAPRGSVGYGSGSELFMRFQQLEADVAQLRGLLEEQGHLIERLSQQQKEQYLDLDRRVTMALKAPSGTTPPIAAAPDSGTDFSSASTPSVASAPSSAGERDAYTAAFDLTRQKRFNEAIDAFNALLVTYPNGEYSGNAFYWLGELYLALPEANLEKSRQSFTQVINLYPKNQKIADAMYKLGIVYHRLGDRAQALEYLNRVQTQFPGTPAARLAQSYAAELR
jgi:tol-pal system protein YbgF